MNWKILTSIIMLLIILIIGGIFLFQDGKISSLSSKFNIADIDNVIDANNQFALDYYNQVKGDRNNNIFFSPFSISSAFAMVYEGARGQTSEEIQSVFYFPENDDLRREEYMTMFNRINDDKKEYEINIANALWAQRDYQFIAEYLNTIEKYYEGEITNLDFKNDSENSRITINNWVENQTNDKIRDLIPSGMIQTDTKLILTNAIYFLGEWIQQFNVDDTKEENFRINKNDTVKVMMMQRTDSKAVFNYTENRDLQILEMPYSGEELSMLILLPKNNNLEKLENLLSVSRLSDWKKNLEEKRVKVFIPRFKFESKSFIGELLQKMGVSIAFSDFANFSGITQEIEGLKIDEVIHQAFIEVNEEGTEAAAATAVVLTPMSAGGIKIPEIPVFRADHPFIFLIQEKSTGNILFMGRVVNPTL
ncbi:MAG: serpin family protein [Candidatus Paceibacterota bacterium]